MHLWLKYADYAGCLVVRSRIHVRDNDLTSLVGTSPTFFTAGMLQPTTTAINEIVILVNREEHSELKS